MADISTITLLNGRTYGIKDPVARSITAGAITIVGKTTTTIEDDSSVNPIIISGESYTARANDAVFFGKKEFVFDGTKWHEFGDMTGLGDLARKDSASGSYTPAGTVSQSQFTGAQMTSTGKFTPSGSISASESNSGNFQPAGTVTAPNITLQTAGTTATVNSIVSVGTLPTLTMDVDELSENLTISFSAGTLPVKGDSVVVKTGDASYLASVPVFTGSKVQMEFTGTEGNVSVSGTTSGSVSQPTFTGESATITVS